MIQNSDPEELSGFCNASREFEAKIADDLVLYFKEGNPFRSMIVYIYDDSDKPSPERYPAVRD